MNKRITAFFLGVLFVLTQPGTAKAAEPEFISTQSGIPAVSENGLFIEAGSCSYTKMNNYGKEICLSGQDF